MSDDPFGFRQGARFKAGLHPPLRLSLIPTDNGPPLATAGLFTAAQDFPLYWRHDRASGEARLSQRRQGDWSPLWRGPVARGALNLDWLDDGLHVFCDGSKLLTRSVTEADGAAVRALHLAGGWARTQIEPPPGDWPAPLTYPPRPAGAVKTQTDLIFDLGLNDGADTDYYLKKGFRVVAVEANDRLARIASARWAEAVREGRLVVLNVAVGARSGEADFFENLENDGWSSLEPGLAGRSGHALATRRVRVVTIEELIAAYGAPHYLKVDIEGADEAVVEGLAEAGALPTFVSVENAPGVETLIKLGFDRFKFVNQNELAGTSPPRPAREGRDVDHVFPFGSSGPFGAESPGPWMDESALRARLDAVGGRRGLGDGVNWWDLHAWRSGARA
ncbi:MAG: FkbM family methyltransferase [Maricaulaceae bacterium]